MASRTSTDPIEILLEMGVDLDDLSEQDYLGALMEAVATIEFQTKGKGDARSAVLRKEIINVRKNRKAADTKFKARKTTVSKSKLLGTSTVVPKKTKVKKEQLLALPAAAEEKEDKKKKPKEKNLLKEIAQSVTNIADILKKQYKLKEKSTEQDRKRAEQQKRKLQEAGLEKRFNGILKTAEKIVAPVRSIFDRILQFLTNILLGKFLVKLVEWIADPDNRSKIKSIIRFLTDNWPKLLSAYIIFGTGLGRFSRFLVKVLARGAVRLVAATTGLLARLFGSRALGRFSRFLGGRRGKFIAGGIEAVTTIVAFKALEDAFTKNLGPEESASIDNDIPIKGYSGGGRVRGELGNATPGQNMLGQANRRHQFEKQMQQRENALKYFKNESALRSKELSSGVDRHGNKFKIRERGGVRERVDLGYDPNFKGYEEGGEVDGPAGIDKVPAMLTDGEFVMSRGAVQKYGLAQLEAMNAAGGGTNRPKIMNGTVFANGGGPIGDRERTPDPELNQVEEFKNRFIYGDRSLLNRAALGDAKGVLEALGIKIDNNTEAVKQNTKQRRESDYTIEGIVAGAVSLAQSLEQQATGLYDQAMVGAAQLYDQSVVFAGQAKEFVDGIPVAAKETYDQSVRGFYAANTDRMRDAEAERYVTQAEFDKLSPEEQLDKLVTGVTNKDGVVMSTKTALTARNQERQTATIERLKKGLNSENPFERFTADIMNRGAVPMPSELLRTLNLTEGFDKAISGLSGGKVKKASAMMSGAEFVVKGLLGPLGNPLRTDASSILEYNKPLMDFAIENNLVNSKGEFLVGRDSWSEILGSKAYATQDISLSDKEREKGFRIVGGTKDRQGAYTVIDDQGKEQTRYTEHLYDKMQRESMGSGFAKGIANYGLGQFAFSVDQESGKAKVTDSWDSNNSAAYYFGASEEALKNGDVYNALFKGLSGVLRVNQNSFFGLGDTGFANTLPAGVDITSRSGFQKALTSTPSSMHRASEQVANSTASKGYFSSTTGQFYPSYADALKDPRVKAAAQIEETKNRFSFAPNQQPNVTIPGMPTNASGSNVTVVKAPSKSAPAAEGNTGSGVPPIDAGNGNKSKWKIFGITMPF